MAAKNKVIFVKLHPGQKLIVTCNHKKRRRNRNTQNTPIIQPDQNTQDFPC
ncbi:hypothetical protein [Paenibacillus segetis]|uniref:Uncharacterized protein n=1 Tax=Paenibacillus segetis TaxID=1325360 RepID=A0ABQ1Y8N3_9BACL|nr:hypothetical protein [Paenibacillus segetis]GGH16638.1 hypothetical protein GCM10008013_11520 [Paenibacillus segetis]